MATLTFTAKQLLHALQAVAGVVERRQTLPILAHVLLEVNENVATLTGTDLEIELVHQFQLQQSYPPLQETLPLQKMLEICRALPSEAILQCQFENQRLTVTAADSRFVLSTFVAAEFPKFAASDTEKQSIKIASEQLQNLLAKTYYAIATQDVRFYLTGMLLEISATEICAVATDGHRLALTKLNQENPLSKPARVIVPRKAISEILRLLATEPQEIHIEFAQRHFLVASQQLKLLTKLIDGQYPPYQQVIPRQHDKIINIEKDLLKATLQRIAILSHEAHKGVQWQLTQNQLVLFAQNPEQEQAQENLIVDYAQEDFTIVLNVQYLLDVLSAFPEGPVRFCFGNAQTGVLITTENDPGLLAVIMPMQP